MLSTVQDLGTSDYEYRQRVRKYRPTSLLPLIAGAAARHYEQEEWLNSPFRKYTPWALADAARVCLAYGTEYNRAEASGQDLRLRAAPHPNCRLADLARATILRLPP